MDANQERLRELVETVVVSATDVAASSAAVHAAVLSNSCYLEKPNFRRIHPSDLELLFDEYDRRSFAGLVRPALGAAPLRFALSRRMTSSGGTTTTFGHRGNGQRSYRISASVAVLYGSFNDDDHREIVVSGITCRNRLEALQRVMEHEIIHLIEMAVWNQSSCSRQRFQSIAQRFFGHTEHKHKMITPREAAMVKFGVRPGMRVRFRHEGRQHEGTVNRVNRRATVLVEDASGQRYSDGRRYAKFYVPVQILEPLILTSSKDSTSYRRGRNRAD